MFASYSRNVVDAPAILALFIKQDIWVQENKRSTAEQSGSIMDLCSAFSVFFVLFVFFWLYFAAGLPCFVGRLFTRQAGIHTVVREKCKRYTTWRERMSARPPSTRHLHLPCTFQLRILSILYCRSKICFPQARQELNSKDFTTLASSNFKAVGVSRLRAAAVLKLPTSGVVVGSYPLQARGSICVGSHEPLPVTLLIARGRRRDRLVEVRRRTTLCCAPTVKRSIFVAGCEILGGRFSDFARSARFAPPPPPPSLCPL